MLLLNLLFWFFVITGAAFWLILIVALVRTRKEARQWDALAKEGRETRLRMGCTACTWPRCAASAAGEPPCRRNVFSTPGGVFAFPFQKGGES